MSQIGEKLRRYYGIRQSWLDRAKIAEFETLVTHDSLTGALNRRGLLEYLDRIIAQAKQYEYPISVILMDIDKFKGVNDKYGHAAGDLILKQLTELIEENTRELDIVARFGRHGGEEFALILPETEVDGAFTLAERLRQIVADTPFQIGEQTTPITISLGVAEPNMEGGNLGSILAPADEMLYAAKKGGRNQVCGFPLESEQL